MAISRGYFWREQTCQHFYKGTWDLMGLSCRLLLVMCTDVWRFTATMLWWFLLCAVLHLAKTVFFFSMHHWKRWEGKLTMLFISLLYIIQCGFLFLSCYIHVIFFFFSVPMVLHLLISHCSNQIVCTCLKSSVLCCNVPSDAVNYSSSQVAGASLLKVPLSCDECAEWWRRLCLKDQRIYPIVNVKSCIYYFLWKSVKKMNSLSY